MEVEDDKKWGDGGEAHDVMCATVLGCLRPGATMIPYESQANSSEHEDTDDEDSDGRGRRRSRGERHGRRMQGETRSGLDAPPSTQAVFKQEMLEAEVGRG